MANEQRTQLWIAGIFLAIIIAITIAAALFSGSAPITGGQPSFIATQTTPLTTSDHMHGSAKAVVTLIEYGDFECPACSQYEPIIQQLYKTYGDRVQFAFRNFPLYQIHPFAMMSAQAAEAAGLQGKYWEMHDILYAKQKEWSTDTSLSTATVISKYFDVYAQSLGLDVKKFDTDILASAATDKVQSDLALGNKASIDHTPTFFLNGTQIANPQSSADFENVLKAAIASSSATIATTTSSK